MAQARHYSPQISRFMVPRLYHEAQRPPIPMTRLTDELLRQQLSGSESWVKAQELRIAEDAPTYKGQGAGRPHPRAP